MWQNSSRTIQNPKGWFHQGVAFNVSKSGRPSSGHRTGKDQPSSQFPRRVGLKNVLTIGQLPSSPMLVVMLKFLHARLQHYANQELPDVQAGLRKGRGTRDQIANICWIIEKAREFQKNIYLCFINYTIWLQHLIVWIIINCGKLLWRWEYQTTLPVSWEICMWVKKQQLEPCMEQLIGSR